MATYTFTFHKHSSVVAFDIYCTTTGQTSSFTSSSWLSAKDTITFQANSSYSYRIQNVQTASSWYPNPGATDMLFLRYDTSASDGSSMSGTEYFTTTDQLTPNRNRHYMVGVRTIDVHLRKGEGVKSYQLKVVKGSSTNTLATINSTSDYEDYSLAYATGAYFIDNVIKETGYSAPYTLYYNSENYNTKNNTNKENTYLEFDSSKTFYTTWERFMTVTAEKATIINFKCGTGVLSYDVYYRDGGLNYIDTISSTTYKDINFKFKLGTSQRNLHIYMASKASCLVSGYDNPYAREVFNDSSVKTESLSFDYYRPLLNLSTNGQTYWVEVIAEKESPPEPTTRYFTLTLMPNGGKINGGTSAISAGREPPESGTTTATQVTFEIDKSAYTFTRDGFWKFVGLSPYQSASSAYTKLGVSDSKWEYTVYSDASGRVSTLLYAIWEEVEHYTYTFTLNANGGTLKKTFDPVETTAESRQFALSADYTPTRNGYTFQGWGLQADSPNATYQQGGTVTLTKYAPSLTIYALWKANANIGLFSWTSDDAANIATDQDVQNIKADVWNNSLQTKIHAVETYLGRTNSSFTTVKQGGEIKADYFNEVRAAIASLTGAGSIVSSAKTGDAILAAQFNGTESIKAALNRAITSANNGGS